MNKIFITVCFILLFCHTSFAESYYFKRCQIGEKIMGDYIIDIDKKIINVKLETEDGKTQKIKDKIRLITKNKIFSEIIQSETKKEYYLQYYLDSSSKTISRQRFIKKHDDDILKPEGDTKTSYCEDVKADWKNAKKEKSSESKETKKQISEQKITLPLCKGNDSSKWNDCIGKIVDKNGNKYEGEYNDGKIIEGTALYPGGSKYYGKFKNEIPHGEGTFIFPDGSKYYGEFNDGKANGQGIKSWKDGREYVGEFKNDKFDGQGTFNYSDGKKYVGEFKNDKRHGEGTLTYANGSVFIGNFTKGVPYGTGSCLNQNGVSVECSMLETKETTPSSGKKRHAISFKGKKWIKEEDRSSEKEKLGAIFNTKASELCKEEGNFEVLNKRIEVLDVSEKTEYKFVIMSRDVIVEKLGISGVVECK